jgi:glyoxylase-like metal-dependent hydrolase (beta-lactamase superfamily II)
MKVSYLVLVFSLLGVVSACANKNAGGAGESNADKYVAVDVDMKLIRVSRHTYFVQGKAGTAIENAGFISNAGFVVTPEGIVVFDALGTPSLAAKLLDKIRSVSSAPIKAVVMSHYHADHLYGLQIFKEQGARVYAPEGARDYLSSDTADNLLAARRKLLAPWVNENTQLVAPDVYVDKYMELVFGDITLQITPLGRAHSEGDLAMMVRPDSVLFSGDIIFEGRIPFIGEANTRNWMKTLDGLRGIKVAALIPGHGPLAKNPDKVIDSTYRYLAMLRKHMQVAVDNGDVFGEAYDKIDWGDFVFLPAFFEANRRNAYNVYLSIENEMLTGDQG